MLRALVVAMLAIRDRIPANNRDYDIGEPLSLQTAGELPEDGRLDDEIYF